MHTSEDSSEVAFLLVGKKHHPSIRLSIEHATDSLTENYQLTASVGLRIGREFLEPFPAVYQSPFSSVWSSRYATALEKRFGVV